VLCGRAGASKITDAGETGDKMRYVVCYSGGADSQVALDLALLKYDDVEIIFCDTCLEFPETYKTIEETAKFYNMDIKYLRAGKTFEEYLDSFNGLYPSIQRRWCTDRLKTRPLTKYIRSLLRGGLRREAQEPGSPRREQVPDSAIIAEIDGIRRDESRWRAARARVEPRRNATWNQIHQVFELSKTEIFAYIDKHGLPLNPLYELGYTRASCWFCPFTSQAENQLLRKTHKLLYEQAKEWERLYGRRFNYVVEDCEKLNNFCEDPITEKMGKPSKERSR
jgi:phosphoadenosine phosphosulfate reductase